MKRKERKPVRKHVMLTEVEAAGLAALADENTSGNDSELIRRILKQAIATPGKYKLLAPGKLAQITGTSDEEVAE